VSQADSPLGVSRRADSRPALATSIVVPTYNEAERLPRSLPGLLGLAGPETEVILVDDGSTDATPALLAESVTCPNVRVLRQPRNRGKGAAVRAGVLASRGRAVVFMDADLATDVASLGPLLSALDDADVAIGSRAHDHSVLHETTVGRSQLGSQFNRLVRSVTNLDFRDTQCGFKAFRAPAAKMLFSLSRVDGFAFDVEVLCLAQRHGMDVVEVPVVWTEMAGSRVRPLVDPAKMAFDVFRTRLTGPRRARVPGIELRTTADKVAQVAALVRNRVRAGDLVFTAHDRVVVILTGATPDEAALKAQCIRKLVPADRITLSLVRQHKVLRTAQGCFGEDATAPTQPDAPTIATTKPTARRLFHDAV
jgi:dolichyl-phosphate beta-glucosyltransferase